MLLHGSLAKYAYCYNCLTWFSNSGPYYFYSEGAFVNTGNYISGFTSNRSPLGARRGFVIILAFSMLIGLGLQPATAVSSISGLKAKQSGSAIELSWVVGSKAPANVLISLRSAGKVVKTVTQRSASKKAKFIGVVPGEYQVQLSSNKPKLLLSTRVLVYGSPIEVSGLGIERQGEYLSINWQLGLASKYNNVESVVVVVKSGAQEVIRTLPAGSTLIRVLDPDYRLPVTVTVFTKNIYGSSKERSVELDADKTARELTDPRLITQDGAEAVFGSFAMINRSALGPVDLSDPAIGADNPVMKALQGCVLSRDGSSAEVQGLANIGSVLATRNATGTMILTSGASALVRDNATEWVDGHSSLGQCVSPVLVAQLKAVGKQLSASSVVDGIRILPVDVSILGAGSLGLLVGGDLFLNGISPTSVSQPMELLWVVKGSGSTITQYILIRAGSVIDQALSQRLLESVIGLNK